MVEGKLSPNTKSKFGDNNGRVFINLCTLNRVWGILRVVLCYLTQEVLPQSAALSSASELTAWAHSVAVRSFLGVNSIEKLKLKLNFQLSFASTVGQPCSISKTQLIIQFQFLY